MAHPNRVWHGPARRGKGRAVPARVLQPAARHARNREHQASKLAARPRASRPRRRPWPRSPAPWPFLAASAPLPGLRVPPAPGRGRLRPATPRLAPSPSDRIGRLAPRPRSRARPHRRTCALRAAPQTTASELRRAPAPGRPAARPPAQGRCPAAPRSRAQPRPPGFVPVAFAEHADANAGWSKLAERLYGRTMAAIDRRVGT
nr:basic proline-rich protein [Aegilops tauschii subsp. strangulata]